MLQGGSIAAVVAGRAVRTPKYLFAVVTGCAVVTPAHLQVGDAPSPHHSSSLVRELHMLRSDSNTSQAPPVTANPSCPGVPI
jgi:hypothetical protein